MYGQLHHIAWWHRDGGASDLENAVLLCGFHHHEVHRLDLDVEPQITGSDLTAPALRSRPTTPAREPGPALPPLAGGTARGTDEQPVLAVQGGAAGRQYVFRTRSGRLHNAPTPSCRAKPAGHDAGVKAGAGGAMRSDL
ncbi:hypothetical protein [Cellulomonas persica]